MKYNSYYDKMTKQPIPSLLLQLSIPTIISMLVTNIYNMADTAFVGRLGTSASGAVGIVFGFMAILQAVGFMCGQGSGSLIARKLGQKDTKDAAVIASTGFFLSLALGFIISIISFAALDPLVRVLGSTETIVPYAKTYITYILIAAPGIVASFCMNNILRFEGKAMYGMMGITLGALLNIIMDPILMFAFGMGIAGAGLSTCISQYVGFCVLLYMFLSGKTQSRLSFRLISKEWARILDIVTTGLPSMLRQVLNSLAIVVLNQHARVYGDPAVAAMSIVSRIAFFVFAIALGVGQGFQPISGFNYGAKKYDRLKKAFWITTFIAEGIMLLITVVVFINSGSLIRVFRDDPQVIEIGVRALRLQLYGQALLPSCMVIEMLFQSTGQKMGASLLSSMRSGLFFIPAIIILARLRGLSGIQEAQPAAYLLSCIPAYIMGIWYFKRLGD